LPERRLLAIKVLGTRGEPRAVPHLRALATDTDPYLAATAVTALVSITGVDAERDLLIELARTGPAPVRWAARQALSRS
jgi:HEAT repeat protein